MVCQRAAGVHCGGGCRNGNPGPSAEKVAAPVTHSHNVAARPASARAQSLDVLRGAAVLLVLGHHHTGWRPLYNLGWTGVDLFFVLSGYLVSGLLFTEYQKWGAINVRRFWLRRGLKIWPAFYAFLIFTLVLQLAAGVHNVQGSLGEAFFLQNYSDVLWLWPHTWSLAVEEHFYLLLPLLLLAVTSRSRDKANPFRAVPLIFAVLAVVCLALRAVTWAHTGSWRATIYPSHLRIDSLFAGVALAYVRHFHLAAFELVGRLPVWVPGLILVSISLVFPAESWVMATIGLTGLYIGYGCILVWMATRPSSKSLVMRALAAVGYYSYSIYLWHGVVAFLLFVHRPTTLLWFIAYLATSIVLGLLMAYLIETPFLELRDRLFPSRSPGSAVAQSELLACQVPGHSTEVEAGVPR